MLRVMVVDDSAVYRKILKMAVTTTGLAQVEAVVSNGTDAIKQMRHQAFDVVLLDVYMPDMNGIDVLIELKKIDADVKVVMVSTAPSELAARLTVDALQKGAVDFLAKPLDENFETNTARVSGLLTNLFSQWVKPSVRAANAQQNTTRTKTERVPTRRRFDMVVISSSTGGPAALEKVMTALPADLNIPVVVVQHMPREFTRILAQSLNNRSPLLITEANHEELMDVKHGYIAPGGIHLALKKTAHQYMFVHEDSAYVNGVKPAADVLFRSIAKEAPGLRVLAVVLTGMGADATDGVRLLKKQSDCYCIAQDEATSVVFGMPRSIIDNGLADEVLPLSAIAARIEELVRLGGERAANQSI